MTIVKTAVLADADGEREDRDDREGWIAAQVPERVADVAAQQIEVLAWGRCENPADRVPPQGERGGRAAAREDVAPLVGECGGHVVAEVAAKVGGEEPQQRAEDAVSA